MSFVKQVYMVDITKLPDEDKWRKFFGGIYENFIHNDTAFNIFWYDFGYEGKYDPEYLKVDPEALVMEKEFRKLLMDAGVPEDAELWLNYWW